MGRTKLYLGTHICIFKGITLKFLSTVQSIKKKCQGQLPPSSSRNKTPHLSKDAGSPHQHSSAEKLVKLCYLTAAQDYLN